MRLGRERPRKSDTTTTTYPAFPRFNEAGARTPQKARARFADKNPAKCFNEAGARTPQKEGSIMGGLSCRVGFNEAGARTPQKAAPSTPYRSPATTLQ